MLPTSSILPLLVLLGSGVPAGLAAQAIRRAEPKAFRFSITPYVGPNWGGGPRARDHEPVFCPVVERCLTYALGPGTVAGVEVHVPLPGMMALGWTASVGRRDRRYCVPLACEIPGRLTSVHSAALLLWRFRQRAPVYLGLGPAVQYLSLNPLTTESGAVIEPGGLLVAALDVDLTRHVGARAAWWNYFLAPGGVPRGSSASAEGTVWESQLTFGLSLAFDDPMVRRPPRTFVP